MIEKLERIVVLRKANSLPAYMRFCHQGLGVMGWSEYNRKGVLDRWLSMLEQRLTQRALDAKPAAALSSQNPLWLCASNANRSAARRESR